MAEILFDEIPSLDLSDFDSGHPERKKKFVQDLGNAYQNIGIAQQQQGFQAAQQQAAYTQALQAAQQQLATGLGVGQLGVQQGQLQLANTAQQQANEQLMKQLEEQNRALEQALRNALANAASPR